MKRVFFLIFTTLCFSATSFSQQDSVLLRRLDSLTDATQKMETEKILGYTYPKLFTIIPREQMAMALEQMYETEEFSTTLDSLQVMTIFPVFEINKGLYAKIKHGMLMRVKFKKNIDSATAESMIISMEAGFGKGSVRFEKSNNTFNVAVIAEMVAIKDEFSPEWSFVNYDKGNQLADLLFSKDVIEKLKEYN